MIPLSPKRRAPTVAWVAALLFSGLASGCETRDRLTFAGTDPGPVGDGPATVIDHPSKDTTVSAGPAYFVSGTETHVLSRGDTLWYLANKKLRVPEWLLRQYNPDLDFGALRIGTNLIVPVIEPRQG